MLPENPHPLHETNAERLERAGGPRKLILGAFGWPSMIAAALLGIVLLIVVLGVFVYRGGSAIFRSHVEKLKENDDTESAPDRGRFSP